MTPKLCSNATQHCVVGNRSMIGSEPNVLVASMGGVGSTALMEFFAADPSVVINEPHGLINPLKHAVCPPTNMPSVRRALFLFGCPYDSLVSLFRRGYAAAHFANVSGRRSDALCWPSDPWQETCRRFGLRQIGDSNKWVDEDGRHASHIGALEWFRQHKARVDAARSRTTACIEREAGEVFRDFDDYLEQGVDHFCRIEQFQRWTTDLAPYPILLVRYETLWEHLPEVFSFMGVPVERTSAFPGRRPRSSDHQALPQRQRALLVRMYGELKRDIDAHDDALVRQGTQS